MRFSETISKIKSNIKSYIKYNYAEYNKKVNYEYKSYSRNRDYTDDNDIIEKYNNLV